jgi:DNA-directed RNA polymerase subunit RPC12/RpoP
MELTQMGALDRLKLGGIIDHSFVIDLRISPQRREIHVDCRDIQRINSDGIKNWVKQFSRLRNAGISISFISLPPILVDLSRYIPGLVDKVEVVSIQLPFRCIPCDQDFVTIQAVRKNSTFEQASKHDCPHCSHRLLFDDLPESYQRLLDH